MESRVPLVSINIPCYHQLAAARRCVESMLAQSFRDFEITLLDDGASDEYRELRRVARRRARAVPAQPGRGSARCATCSRPSPPGAANTRSPSTRTTCSAAHYLATRSRILESDPSCGFVGGRVARVHGRAAPADELGALPLAARRRAVRDRRPTFCARSSAASSRCSARSCIAAPRSTAWPRRTRRSRRWSIGRSCCRSCDRWSGAIIRDPLVWYRQHGDGDARHLAMSADHILRLFAAVPRGAAGAAQRRGSGAVLRLQRLLAVHAVRYAARRTITVRRSAASCPRVARAACTVRNGAAGYGRKRLIALVLTGQLRAATMKIIAHDAGAQRGVGPAALARVPVGVLRRHARQRSGSPTMQSREICRRFPKVVLLESPTDSRIREQRDGSCSTRRAATTATTCCGAPTPTS